jgi:hypothetical protein
MYLNPPSGNRLDNVNIDRMLLSIDKTKKSRVAGLLFKDSSGK